MEPIGLIAGNRRFPLIVAEAARKQGFSVVAIAIRGDTSRQLERFADKVFWTGLDGFDRMVEIFKQEGVRRVVMAGQVSPCRLFSREVERSPFIKGLLSGLKGKNAEAIFSSVALELEKSQIEVLDSTFFIKELLPKKGVLTKREPTFSQWEDIYFGFDLAKQVALLDIGQTLAVRAKAVVAVEALEGTDNLIRRAGRLSRGGFSLVKVSKPRQDMRFDIPVVGLVTVRNMIHCKASCLAMESEKTLFIDMEESVNLANRKGLAITAL
jgi:UDP-2,3-diacylglucosamine hydrolase